LLLREGGRKIHSPRHCQRKDLSPRSADRGFREAREALVFSGEVRQSLPPSTTDSNLGALAIQSHTGNRPREQEGHSPSESTRFIDALVAVANARFAAFVNDTIVRLRRGPPSHNACCRACWVDFSNAEGEKCPRIGLWAHPGAGSVITDHGLRR